MRLKAAGLLLASGFLLQITACRKHPKPDALAQWSQDWAHSEAINRQTLDLALAKVREGDPEAMEMLAGAYQTGMWGVKMNPEKAQYWITQAELARKTRGQTQSTK